MSAHHIIRYPSEIPREDGDDTKLYYYTGSTTTKFEYDYNTQSGTIFCNECGSSIADNVDISNPKKYDDNTEKYNNLACHCINTFDDTLCNTFTSQIIDKLNQVDCKKQKLWEFARYCCKLVCQTLIEQLPDKQDQIDLQWAIVHTVKCCADKLLQMDKFSRDLQILRTICQHLQQHNDMKLSFDTTNYFSRMTMSRELAVNYVKLMFGKNNNVIEIDKTLQETYRLLCIIYHQAFLFSDYNAPTITAIAVALAMKDKHDDICKLLAKKAGVPIEDIQRGCYQLDQIIINMEQQLNSK